MLNWLQRFNIFCYLDNHQYHINPHRYECLVAAGAINFIDTGTGSEWEAVDSFLHNQWTFGHLAYDFKNHLLGTPQQKASPIDFPDFFFFQPEIVIELQENQLTIRAENPQKIYEQILNQQEIKEVAQSSIFLQQRLTKEEYLQRVR